MKDAFGAEAYLKVVDAVRQNLATLALIRSESHPHSDSRRCQACKELRAWFWLLDDSGT
jgi:hypothetical protein